MTLDDIGPQIHVAAAELISEWIETERLGLLVHSKKMRLLVDSLLAIIYFSD